MEDLSRSLEVQRQIIIPDSTGQAVGRAVSPTVLELLSVPLEDILPPEPYPGLIPRRTGTSQDTYGPNDRYPDVIKDTD